MSNFNLTLFEACEYLNRSKKTLSRYIRQGLLHPKQTKSQQGTLEYRFSKDDLDAFKARTKQEKTNQETGDTPDKTKQGSQGKSKQTKKAKIQAIIGETKSDETGHNGDEIISLLKETTGLLKEQLVKKDEQIKDLGGKIDQLIDRDRETNILIGQLQSKVLMLEKPSEIINGELKETGHETDQTRQDEAGETGQIEPVRKKGFIERIKKFFKETK